jgi:hypothetical protein
MRGRGCPRRLGRARYSASRAPSSFPPRAGLVTLHPQAAASLARASWPASMPLASPPTRSRSLREPHYAAARDQDPRGRTRPLRYQLFDQVPEGRDAGFPLRRHDQRQDSHDGSRAATGCLRTPTLPRSVPRPRQPAVQARRPPACPYATQEPTGHAGTGTSMTDRTWMSRGWSTPSAPHPARSTDRPAAEAMTYSS